VSLELIFMGTPDFAVPTLEHLVDQGHRFLCVYSQPPQPAGRGMAPRRSPVQQAAERLGIAVRTPVSLKSGIEHDALRSLRADAAVVVAYGLVLPLPALEATRLGAFNLHASLLPRWRGAAPIQRAIMAGDAETGVAVMRMDQGLDTGPVCLEERVAIAPGMTSGELHGRLAHQGARLMGTALSALEGGALACRPQASDGVTYAAKIDKAEARIDFGRPATEVASLIHGLSPRPAAWCLLAGRRLRLLKAVVEPGSGSPGTCLDDRLAIACGQGAVRPLLLQLEGKAALPLPDFLRGHRVAPGTRLA
jgi:methionyl-tRNA formyltransferase